MTTLRDLIRDSETQTGGNNLRSGVQRGLKVKGRSLLAVHDGERRRYNRARRARCRRWSPGARQQSLTWAMPAHADRKSKSVGTTPAAATTAVAGRSASTFFNIFIIRTEKVEHTGHTPIQRLLTYRY